MDENLETPRSLEKNILKILLFLKVGKKAF